MNPIKQQLKHDHLIVWKPEYDLGISIVDEQHRGIVSTINSLYYGMQNKHGDDVLIPTVHMIYEYTRIHFHTEEELFRKCLFSGLQAHIELHDELTNALLKVGNKSLWERDPEEFMKFLKTWWIEHICDKDREVLDSIRRGGM